MHFKYIYATTIDTATYTITSPTIAGTTGTSSNITIKPIATIGDTDGISHIIITITFITITTTITIDTTYATAGTTSVINKVTSDTRANVSESAVTNKNGSKR